MSRKPGDEETEWDYYFDQGFHPDRYSQEDL